MTFKFSSRSISRMSNVDNRLQEIAHLALQISRVDFGIPAYGGFRSTEEQAKLFDGKQIEDPSSFVTRLNRIITKAL